MACVLSVAHFVHATLICGFLSLTTDGLSLCFYIFRICFGVGPVVVCLQGRGDLGGGGACSMVSLLKGGWWVSLVWVGFGLLVKVGLKGCFYGGLQYMW